MYNPRYLYPSTDAAIINERESFEIHSIYSKSGLNTESKALITPVGVTENNFVKI